jgi:hypothetical protein
MDTVGIRVPTRQTREFYTFSVSSTLRNSPSASVSLLQTKFTDFWVFLIKTLSLLRTCRYRMYLDDYMHLVLFCSHIFYCFLYYH